MGKISTVIVWICLLIIVAHETTGAEIVEWASGSCLQRCMEPFNETFSCHCHASCLADGNCCDDYVPTCLPNSTTKCYGRCFGYYPDGNCFCDDECSKYGNCCHDFVEECANINLCENRCFVWYDGSLPCQCNDQCQKYGNCCEDYEESCLPGSCEGKCGTRNETETCQCDAKCIASEYDCCGDYEELCTTEDSCQGLCGIDYDYSRSCQCNDQCNDHDNCCSDYNSLCIEHYLCEGRCNVTYQACSCEETCTDNNNCCTDYEQSCSGAKHWLEDECTSEQDMKCPSGFKHAPVILFSLDGFRDSYIYRNLTPTLWKLASCGVHSPYMRSVYPTLTFPNHYTIATGLYPESHGIIGNSMYDHEHKEEFNLGSENAEHSFWWGGEPIWITTSKQGLKSASYFWVGSDVDINGYPDYYYKYDGSVPNEERIYQALKWLDMPPDERPSFIAMYMDIVDHAGHAAGPASHEVNEAIAEADRIIGMLMDGLKARGLDKCVNLIVLADHGMANRSCDRVTYVEDYDVDMDTVYYSGGAQGRVGKSENEALWPLFNANEIGDKLKCQKDSHFQASLKYEYLPKRYHYAYNDRIEDVLLVLDEEWILGGKSGSVTGTGCKGGTHGWDNEFDQMHAVFLAHGSGFKRGFNTTIPFENIQMYNLVADLLGLDAAPNNGTTGSLYHVMKNPPTLPAENQGTAAQMCEYPSVDSSSEDLGCNICEGESEANQQLDLSNEQVTKARTANMLWGPPRISPPMRGNEDDVMFCLLTQEDYVTAYDWTKKMPYYSAYVLDRELRDFENQETGCVRPDIRLTASQQTPCSAYDGALSQGFLYPPVLSKKSSRSDAQIVSNTVPIYSGLKPIWDYLPKVLANWADLYDGITVVAGPAFDYDYDGHADSMETIQKLGKFVIDADNTSSPVPTHYFVVATRCRERTAEKLIRDCANNPDDIEVIGFIIPNFQQDPCFKDTMTTQDWVSDTLFEHVARMKDVELLTKISFFSSLSASTQASQEVRLSALRAKLALPEFSGSWLQDFVNSVTPNPEVYETTTLGADPTFPLWFNLLLFACLACTQTLKILFT